MRYNELAAGGGRSLNLGRELRELIRYRRSLIEERAREVNRIQKVLEGANIKLSSVASDILGKSATV